MDLAQPSYHIGVQRLWNGLDTQVDMYREITFNSAVFFNIYLVCFPRLKIREQRGIKELTQDKG